MLIKARSFTKNLFSLKNFSKKVIPKSETHLYVSVLHAGFRVLIGGDGIFIPKGKKIVSKLLNRYFEQVMDMASARGVVFDGVLFNPSFSAERIRKQLIEGKEITVPLTFFAYDIIENKVRTYAERIDELKKFNMDFFVPMSPQIYQNGFVFDRVKAFFQANIFGVLIQSVYDSYDKMNTTIMVVNNDR